MSRLPTHRLATADDFRRYAGQDLPPEWCIEGRVIGYVAEDGGEVIAIGIVTWDEFGRAWGWFHSRQRIAAVTMHRLAKRTMAVLRAVDEPALHAGCDYRIPGSEKWLKRLGFAHAPELSCAERQVFRCDL